MGRAAREKLIERGPWAALDGCDGFYLLDVDGIGGSVQYFAMDYESEEQCWAILEAMQFVDRDDFSSWSPPKYAVIMDGPGHFGPEYATGLWDVANIGRGLAKEANIRDEHLEYFAIDLDRKRLYAALWFGGFPSEETSASRQPASNERKAPVD
jgi:hypothetical protein